MGQLLDLVEGCPAPCLMEEDDDCFRVIAEFNEYTVGRRPTYSVTSDQRMTLAPKSQM